MPSHTAIYEHKPLMQDTARREAFAAKLLTGVVERCSVEVHGWAILPNHCHVLAAVDLSAFRKCIRTLHSGIATQWNRKDDTPGWKVWYEFPNRAIRSDRHYYAALNYIHGNPVKHGYAAKADDWRHSSGTNIWKTWVVRQ